MNTEGEVIIPLDDESECMEVALLLVSQGVGSTPVELVETTGWGVLIDSADFSRCEKLIRQFRLEEELEGEYLGYSEPAGSGIPGSTFSNGVVIGWMVLLAFIFLWAPDRESQLKIAGVLNGNVLELKEYFRLVTSVCLHGDLEHLALNLVTGFLFTSLACWRFGTGRGLFGSLLAGAFANAVYCYYMRDVSYTWGSLGASGMIFGSLGLLVHWSPRWLSLKFLFGGNPFRKLTSLIGALCLFGLMGLSPGSNWIAHLFGLIGGILLAGWWQMRGIAEGGQLEERSDNWFYLLVFIIAVAGSWGLALIKG